MIYAENVLDLLTLLPAVQNSVNFMFLLDFD